MGTPLRSKPPLITPSASPHPPRFSSRLPDHPSPSKKQRRTFHEFASSSMSRTQTPVPDIQKEREASTLRLLGVWASLAERYSRHMDDDDLVDIRTGKIIRDNGILRNAPTLQFGTLAAPVGVVNEVEDEEDEYDFDELDAFAENTIDADEEAKSELDTRGLIVPPANSLDQAHADDLREFLEEEKIRKEQCGTDVDEDSEDPQSVRGDSEDNIDDVVELGVVRAVERRPVRSDDQMRELGFPPRDNGNKEDGFKLIEGQGTCSEPIVVTSDDELDFWKADNSNAVRVVHKDRLNVIDSDIEILGSFSCQKLPTTQRKNARTPKTRQLHTPPRSQSSSKLSVSPLTTGHSDAPGHSNPISDSDFSGNDSSPSSSHRKRALLKHKNLRVKPASPQMSNSMSQSSGKIFRRGHSPHTASDRGNDPEIPPVPPSTKGSSKPKQRAVVLLTPRKALKHLGKHADGHISGRDRNDGRHDESPEVSSPRRFSIRKGKAKERDDVVVPTPDQHPTSRNVKIPLHTGLYVADTEPDESAVKPSPTRIPKGDDVVEASRKRSGKHPHAHSLKRKRDSYSTVDVSEATMESPKKNIASGSPSLQNRSASANYSPSTKWQSRESRTDSDSEYDEPICAQSQRAHRKRSASCVETPHFPYSYATPNHQNHVANMFTPIPDPRAQLIIAQAVQQLSALVTGVWQPPAPHYLEGSSPRTPQRRSVSVQPLGTPRIYPYPYDPAFSGASFPPESPELEHCTTTSRRSLVSRSRSRVRKVTFQLNGEESDTQEDTRRTPTSNRRSMNADALAKTHPERDDHGSLERARRIRGQTPGPSSNFHREIHK